MFTVLVHTWCHQKMVWEPLYLSRIIFASWKLNAYFFASPLTSISGVRHIPDLSSTCRWKQDGHASSKCSYQCVRELWAWAWAWPRQLSCGFSKAVCMLMAETCWELCPGFYCEEMPDKPKLIDTVQNMAYKKDALKCREQETKRKRWGCSILKETQGS